MSAPGAAASTQHLPLAAAGTRARLSFYAPGLRQRPHRHEQAHVSIVVAGSLREASAGRDETSYALQLNLRPRESTHQVEFGPQGALILAVDVDDCLTPATASGWIYRDLSLVQRTLLRSVLDGRACDADVGDSIQDLVAVIEEESLRGSPPGWLIQARDRLMDDPAGVRIEELARAACVHRAHFARAFHHWFQTPPSLFRRRAMLCRAIAMIASGLSLGLAAQTAGFADQSHLCRSMRAMIGTSPSRLWRRA
jgi:AraC family transcriptional regulator